jgi:Ca-activated chloride channel family protein
MYQTKRIIIFTLAMLAILALTACESSPDTKPSRPYEKTSHPYEGPVTVKPLNEGKATNQPAPAQNQQPVTLSKPGRDKASVEETVIMREVTKQKAVTGGNVMPMPTPAARLAGKKEQLSPMTMAIGDSLGYSQGYVPPDVRVAAESLDRENYAHLDNNPIKRVTEHPVSTFSIDVDTGSYSNVRRMLREGRLPPHDAVRIEELINYFSYHYPVPVTKNTPFSVSTEIAPSPWNAQRHLLRIGIKGYEVPKSAIPAANLVFLIDVSGSMHSANKLGLLKQSLTLLTKQLSAKDRVSMVVYAGASGVVLSPTPGNEKATILQAIQRLQAGGSTNGAAGIRLAYQMAEQSFIPNGINRILLATDGDFNVGTVSFEALKSMVEEKRKSGVTLTTLGFGEGNYNDHLAEQLADNGNGANYYIDSLQEAQKVLVDQLSSTMQTIAADTKIQIEFNPNVVSEYRLIGYENRMLKREDFNNDKVDAGDIGAGHTVTALYEITLTDKPGSVDPLRYGEGYGKRHEKSRKTNTQEIAFLRLRYKHPGKAKSHLIEQPLYRHDIQSALTHTSNDFRFAASVAAFGQLLKGGKYTNSYNYDDVMNLARHSRGDDPFGYRSEFLQLVNLAKALSTHKPAHKLELND